MGKGLIWLGTEVQKISKAIVCGWNKFVLALMINVNDCPNKICSCKK